MEKKKKTSLGRMNLSGVDTMKSDVIPIPVTKVTFSSTL